MKNTIASDKVAIYIRWSTEDQGQGHTLEIQRESCRYYCLSQGWAVREDLTFIDDGCSGSNLDRPALTRLRQGVTSGLIDCVVLYKLDRLSRNIKDIINLVLDEWEDTCSVRSTQEPVDTTSDAGKMFFTMLGSFADFERSSIKTRTWSGKRKNAEKGRNPGMPYSYGFRKSEDGGFEIEEAEATVVREVFDQYIKGRSCRLIAFALNDRGTRTRSGRMWANADISRLLRNELYIGRLVYNRKAFAQKKKLGRVITKDASEIITFDRAAPPIIEQPQWEQAQRIRLSRPRIDRSGSARAQGSPYLLAGVLKCPCGHSWVGVQGGKGNDRYYSCAGARSGGPAKCTNRMVKSTILDSFILDRVRGTWPVKGPFRAEILARISERLAHHEAMVKDLNRRFQALDGALGRFKNDYKLGKLTAEMYSELSEEVRQDREEMTRLLRAADGERRELTDSHVDLEAAEVIYARLDAWDALELTERQHLLRMLLSRVTLSRPKGTKDLSVHIEWRLPAPSTHSSIASEYEDGWERPLDEGTSTAR